MIVYGKSCRNRLHFKCSPFDARHMWLKAGVAVFSDGVCFPLKRTPVQYNSWMNIEVASEHVVELINYEVFKF